LQRHNEVFPRHTIQGIWLLRHGSGRRAVIRFSGRHFEFEVLMAYDFPASPTSGQTYTPSGGPTYTWDGTVWKTASTGAPVIVYSADTPPGTPVIGTLWFNSADGNLYIYYSDGTSSQWVPTTTGTGTSVAPDEVVNGIITIASSAPSSPATGDVWIDTT
jgi:hypothetical protein